MSDDKQCFFVESPDGRKFKMVIRGDLGRLGVSKIRRYLANYGVQDDCFLAFDGVALEDDMVGEDFGLHNNAVLQISYEEPKKGEAQPVAETRSPSHARAEREGSRAANAAPLKPHDAWSAQHGDTPNSRDLQAQIALLQAEKAELERTVHTLSAAAKTSAKGGGGVPVVDGFTRAKENLQILAEDLRLPLQFDANGTCVLNGEDRSDVGLGDGLSLFISYDAQTQRVVLYTTLLTRLPRDNPAVLHKLYEVLLEGSLLGREVCGGGVGISRESGLVVLQTSFSAIHCDTTLLRDTVPVFVETVRRWRHFVNELVS